MADLYRKSSLERISNPEQLDKAITVSSPMSWLALAGVALIIVAVIIWSFAEKIPEITKADGIIISAQDKRSEEFNTSGYQNAAVCYVDVKTAESIKENIKKGEKACEAKVTLYSDGRVFSAKVAEVKSSPLLKTPEGVFSVPQADIQTSFAYVYSAVLCVIDGGGSIEDGALASVEIKTGEVSPIHKVFGGLGK